MTDYVTPTAWAEEAYEAKLKQNRPMRRGPAGLPLPSPKAFFRKEADRKLISALVAAALKAKDVADGRPVPTDYLLRRGARAGFSARCMSITHWPSQFRTRTGLYPRWFQIEAEFPWFGEWMKGQRNG